ncbi:hypothetical protein [Desulfuromonas thiophila]|uniref:hypothetical protein n=1 Tax=Desulfuromonas thiophila TaxID=57664 RepID=UPI0024A8205A|nr:hypothetical protein [Desulfuromonas thiophila]
MTYADLMDMIGELEDIAMKHCDDWGRQDQRIVGSARDEIDQKLREISMALDPVIGMKKKVG